jgi:hypothetical protein
MFGKANRSFPERGQKISCYGMHFIFYTGAAVKKTMPSAGVTSFEDEGVTASGIVFFRMAEGSPPFLLLIRPEIR